MVKIKVVYCSCCDIFYANTGGDGRCIGGGIYVDDGNANGGYVSVLIL